MNILIIEARYFPAVADALMDGATAALEKGAARFERLSLPGVLEIVPALAMAVRAGKYDGYVALGAVAGPAHIADAYYTQAMQGLTALGTQGLAIGNGLVLASDEGAALDMALRQDIGGDAARACLALATHGERLGYSR
ncbi:MAG: hypothetical protein BGN82_05015 [Alphaproteobacteria bacterium 65-7]|nr:MAG: hypothetical protein BGN82_05015 [Alphaproteobacteria bacterium 65-7]